MTDITELKQCGCLLVNSKLTDICTTHKEALTHAQKLAEKGIQAPPPIPWVEQVRADDNVSVKLS